MSELTNITAQRDDVLAKIREIEESCEGIENENNAKRVQQLNLEKAQLTAQKQKLLSELSVLETKLSVISNEITKLSGTGVDRILKAIKKQRWYFFKNKTKVLMDRNTGYIYPSINVVYKKEFDSDGNEYIVNNTMNDFLEYDIDDFVEWNVPTKNHIVEIVNPQSECPLLTGGHPNYINSRKYICNKATIYCKDGNSCGYIWLDYDFPKMADDGIVFPYSVELIKDINYQNNVSANNPVYTEKEQLQFTLDLFTENDLWPIFDDEEITELYKKIYFEKPKLLGQLQELQGRLEVLQNVTLLSSEFDYRNLLLKYDLKAIDGSVIKYCHAIDKWCDELLEKIEYYNIEKKQVITEYEKIMLPLREDIAYPDGIDEQDMDMLDYRQQMLKKSCLIDMNGVAERIFSFKNQSADLMDRIYAANRKDKALQSIAKIESEERVSFELFAENTANEVKEALYKIERFENITDYSKKCIEIWRQWTTDYIDFNTVKREAFIDGCLSKNIDKVGSEELFLEWHNIRFIIESLLSDFIECSIQKGSFDYQKEIAAASNILDIFEKYKKTIDDFYDKDRINLYVENISNKSGQIQNKLLNSQMLYKMTVNFIGEIADVVGKCSNMQDKLRILNLVKRLQPIYIDNIVNIMDTYGIIEKYQDYIEQIIDIKNICIKLSNITIDIKKLIDSGDELKEILNEIIFDLEDK